MAEALPVMLTLERSAVEVDAEPGWTAGFHVHVSMNGASHTDRQRMLWRFMEWEPVLMYIARGRFPGMREMNTSLATAHGPWIRRSCDINGYAYDVYYGAADGDRYTGHYVTRPNATLRGALHDHHSEADRHSNLNVRTRYNTWEMRLWNSTRSAWRMQLWCELSLAFLTPTVSASLPRPSPPESLEENADKLIAALRNAGNPIAADLLARQQQYTKHRADSTPESFVLA